MRGPHDAVYIDQVTLAPNTTKSRPAILFDNETHPTNNAISNYVCHFKGRGTDAPIADSAVIPSVHNEGSRGTEGATNGDNRNPTAHESLIGGRGAYTGPTAATGVLSHNGVTQDSSTRATPHPVSGTGLNDDIPAYSETTAATRCPAHDHLADGDPKKPEGFEGNPSPCKSARNWAP